MPGHTREEEEKSKKSGKKKSTIMGGRNVKNLGAMVAAGIITQAEADAIRKGSKEAAKKKKKGLFSFG